MTRAKTVLFPVLGALLLGLTACVPEVPVSSGLGGTLNTSQHPEPGTEDSHNQDSDSNDSNGSNKDSSDATEEQAQPEVTREQCVIGTWQADNSVFETYMNMLIPDPSMRMSITGASLIRFDEAGSFYSWREDFTMTTRAQGQTVVHVSNSAETGDYGLVLDFGAPPSTDFLWVAETMKVMHDEVLHVGGIATLVNDGGGSTIELFNGFRGDVPVVEGEPLEGSLPFTCAGNVLTFEFDIGDTMSYYRTSAAG